MARPLCRRKRGDWRKSVHADCVLCMMISLSLFHCHLFQFLWRWKQIIMVLFFPCERLQVSCLYYMKNFDKKLQLYPWQVNSDISTLLLVFTFLMLIQCPPSYPFTFSIINAYRPHIIKFIGGSFCQWQWRQLKDIELEAWYIFPYFFSIYFVLGINIMPLEIWAVYTT